MNHLEKIRQLREEINRQLLPLIDADYAYLELPYYPNIGDTLIWEGTRLFLAQTRFKCLYSASFMTFSYRRLSPSALILLQGGGNFGDLWEDSHLFRKKVIEMYPENPVIIFPQSVCYGDTKKIAGDETFFAAHPNVTLCARDRASLEFMQRHFPDNPALLVPDMAFFIAFEKHGHVVTQTGRTLYAKRTDMELKQDGWPTGVPPDAEVHDWPTFEKKEPRYARADYIEGWLNFFANIMGIKPVNRLRDLMRAQFYRPHYLRDCVRFIDRYDTVYSTRLHVALAAAMMGKTVRLLDNSYGKNFGFYDTWLTDMDNMEKV